MIEKPKDRSVETDTKVTAEEVNRVLEVGRILFSVLTEEEIKALTDLLLSKEKNR